MINEFEEDKRAAVFTTRSIREKAEPILFVFHHAGDGTWEFIGNANYSEADYIIVALEEIIQIDSTVLELSKMAPGYQAFRKNVNSLWQVRYESSL